MCFAEKINWTFFGNNKKLRDVNNRGGFFSKKLDNVHINITNNRLSELSQYAVTPDELRLFYKTTLKSYKCNEKENLPFVADL